MSAKKTVLNYKHVIFHIGDRIWVYDFQICRSMAASYTNVQTNYEGLPTYIFESDFGEDINVKNCYCRNEHSCPPKGTFDLFRCTGVPMIASLPHFYKAEELLSGVESGLHPTKKDHEITTNLEIVSYQRHFLNRAIFFDDSVNIYLFSPY